MAALWPTLPLFLSVSVVPPATHLAGTSRARFLCLEYSIATHSMSPPPNHPSSKADSHVHRIKTCHRLWRDSRLGAASHAARNSRESALEKASLTNEQLIDSIASWDGTDHPAHPEATTSYHKRSVQVISDWLRAAHSAFQGLCQTDTTTRRRQTVAADTFASQAVIIRRHY